MCVKLSILTFAAEGEQKFEQEKKDGQKMRVYCVFLYDYVLFSLLISRLGCNAGGIQKRESNRHEERERNDTGERENQPAFTQRQSISPPLSLFPMGWPG